jgi:hypothetical protein
MYYLPVWSDCDSIVGNTADTVCTQQVMLHIKMHCNQPGGECPQGCTVPGLHLQNAVLMYRCPVSLLWLYYLGDSAMPFDMRQGLENSVQMSLSCLRISKLNIFLTNMQSKYYINTPHIKSTQFFRMIKICSLNSTYQHVSAHACVHAHMHIHTQKDKCKTIKKCGHQKHSYWWHSCHHEVNFSICLCYADSS